MRFSIAFVTAVALLHAQGPEPQKQLEARYDSLLKRDDLQQWLKQLSARPHHVGSAAGKDVAEFIAAQFRSWGYDTEIEKFYPLFPVPKVRVLEMTAPSVYKARLVEPPIEGDDSTAHTEGGLPTYNAYSTDGDVTADLVYVNYGVPDDYKRLAELGVEVKGKIVIARYGGSWRGIKPKVAAEHGAAGCLIYSDPKDDGYWAGDEYPQGGWRTEWGVQRGSVMDMPKYPGDPLTPGVGATRDAKRLTRQEAQTITMIPVLPIAWGDAEPLLKALSGPVAPAEWRGALPFTYHVGPGPAKVHLKLEFDWTQAEARDVIARLKGGERPKEWVIRGNHHDGWVFGASDPLTGLVSMMEEARAIGELARQGWRPRRTIIFCAWDGEEPALLGSTEWAEQHAAELQQHAVAYVNSDSTSRGFVSMGGSHVLETFASDVARNVTDPETRVSVYERRRAAMAARGSVVEGDIPLSALGSGSDYTPFLQHLGITSLNIGFGGEGAGGGSYHSNYDTYDHVVKFEDPDFQYMLATAQLGGRMMLRLADANVLPWRVSSFVQTVSRYAGEVQKLADTERSSIGKQNALIRSRSLTLAADPTRTFVAPALEPPAPFLNFAPLQNVVDRLNRAAQSVAKVDFAALPEEKAKAVDALLMGLEQTLLSDKGLPNRPWYKHMVYAPGYYTGYGVKTLPGIREAIEQHEWAEADAQIVTTAKALERYAAAVERLATLVR